mmetsp:Transcript_2277/g.3919  ORF Transcript_2277/g.3919 Transcript_2277/m.3919 type:complete len:152 (-) Transcript_2277:63-518(-)
MVFFTIFATFDSITLLFAMTGLLAAALYSLKAIADIEYDLINVEDFTRSMKTWHTAEVAAMVLNVVALLPFIGSWWMAPPQFIFALMQIAKWAMGGHKIDTTQIYKKSVYLKQRNWHTVGMFFYLISWFIYFARTITAIMDIHVHGISPYD